MSKCKVLFLAANPAATERLALDEEIREIERLVRASEFRDSLELVSLWAVRPDDLIQSLNQHKPQIVHFSGHGSSSNCLLLQGDDGQVQPVPEAALEKLFQIFQEHVKIVVLNCCYSESQAHSIAKSISCTIGMNTAVGDKSAIKFAASFYRAIGFGCNVKDSFDQGRLAVQMAGELPNTPARGSRIVDKSGQSIDKGQHSIPQLIVNDKVDPDNLLLVKPVKPPAPTNINRGVSIGGNVTAGSIVTGNQNVVNQTFVSNAAQFNFQQNQSTVELRINVARLKSTLDSLVSDQQKKIGRAFEDVQEELADDKPDLCEIGSALARIFGYAARSAGYQDVRSEIRDCVSKLAMGLGTNGESLQKLLADN